MPPLQLPLTLPPARNGTGREVPPVEASSPPSASSWLGCQAAALATAKSVLSTTGGGRGKEEKEEEDEKEE